MDELSYNLIYTTMNCLLHSVPAHAAMADPDGAAYSANSTIRNLSPRGSFRSVVLSAVYTERHTLETRVKNAVVSGLSVNSDVDDKTAVEQLCQTEMKFDLIFAYVVVLESELWETSSHFWYLCIRLMKHHQLYQTLDSYENQMILW